MLLFLKEINVESYSYSTLYKLGNAKDHFFEENFVSNEEIVLKFIEIFRDNISFSKLFKPTILRHTLEYLFVKNPTYIFSKMYLYVNFNGNIYPQDQLISEQFCIGNIYDINETNIKSICEKLNFYKFKYEFNKETCLKCNFYPFCIRGNYGELLALDDTLEMEFPDCDDLRN